jgi:tetratricopeptide (TPR) repeat protein
MMNDGADHIDWGTRYLALGLPRIAVEQFDRAIAQDSANVGAWKGRGAARLEQGDTEGAIADYDESVRLDPTDAGAWTGRGCAHLENDDPDRAIVDFTQALRLEPENLAIYNQRISAYGFRRDFACALADCAQMARLCPDDPLPICRRAEILCSSGDYQGAILAYDQAIAVAPRAQHYHDRGRVHAMRGDQAAANADFSEAIRLDPGSPGAFSARSRARAALGDRAQANADYDAALRLGLIQSIDYCWNRSCALEALGEREIAGRERAKALENCEAGLRIFPQDESLQNRLTKMRQKTATTATAATPEGGNST